jgi:hypothetical protein
MSPATGVMSDAAVAATAAAAAGQDTPTLSATLDDVWGSESESSAALEKALESGVDDPIAAKALAEGREVLPAAPEAPIPEGNAPPAERGDGMPPTDVLPTPAAPEAEPEPEVDPALAGPGEEEEEEIPDDAKSGKGKNAWSKTKAEKKALKLENTELKKQLETAQSEDAGGEASKRIEQLEKEAGEYEDRIGQYDITQTAAFNEKFTTPLVDKYKRVVALLSKNGDAEGADAIARQLLNPSIDRDALISEHPITTQAALGAILVEMDDLQERRDSAIGNWRETKAVLTEQETRQGVSSLNKSITEDTNKAVEDLRSEGNYLYMLSETDDNWNKGVQERISALQGTLKEGERGDMVKLVADGLTARTYREWYEKEHKRAEKMAAALNAKIQSAPNLGTAPAGSAPAAPVTPGKPRPMTTVMDDVWGKDEQF